MTPKQKNVAEAMRRILADPEATQAEKAFAQATLDDISGKPSSPELCADRAAFARAVREIAGT